MCGEVLELVKCVLMHHISGASVKLVFIDYSQTGAVSKM